MLYLAEVQKQKTGFMGAAKAEIKLLAYQRVDQSWQPVQGEEVIPVEEASNLNAGALVLADLNANRQVQRLQEAGRPLVSMLQNFSRQLEKSKHQEAEIEQWKESLNYQTEEINRRQMEMEAQLEQLAQAEATLQQLEAQQQEISSGRETVTRLQTELERNRAELEGAWEHLKGEKQRWEEQVSSSQLIGEGFTLAIREQLNSSLELVETQQNILSYHWQQLEQQRGSAQQQQEEVDRQVPNLFQRWEEWQQQQTALEQTKARLQADNTLEHTQQELLHLLDQQLQKQEELQQQIGQIAQPDGSKNLNQRVDFAMLEQMSIEQLQQLVQDLQRDWQGASHFVNEQEEELKFKQQAINELQAKLNHIPDSERAAVQAELAEEQDSYQFLNQTLVGQRQNLQERRETLSQHSRVLWRRQGMDTGNQQIDLELVQQQIQAQKQQQAAVYQQLQQEIEQMQSRRSQLQEAIANQTQAQEAQRQELQTWEQNLLTLRTATAESWGRVNLYQEMLQPVQDSLDGLRHKLQAITETISQLGNSSN